MRNNISATGQLTTQKGSNNIKLVNFSLNYHGQQLIQDTDLSINSKNRYGLLGLNGSGKSALLYTIANRLVNIPEYISMYYVDREAEASQLTATETVLQNLEVLIERLETEYEQLCEDDPNGDRCNDVCNRLDELEPEMAATRVGKILAGLGFDKELQNTKCCDLSGGWRMRVALAKALFASPDLLVLDDPTSHLDLTAVVWLERYLANYPRTLLMTSHSQDFLNQVCTNIILLRKNKLHYYKGNFDTYVKTRKEQEENQAKMYKWEQNQIKEIKAFIAKFGHGTSKMVRQAQSREKVLMKMYAEGLTEAVEDDRISALHFHNPGQIPPPVIAMNQVTFGYDPSKPPLYKQIDFGVDLDSRIAFVGPNGAGKSTLIKLMMGVLIPTDGDVKLNSHLRFGWYNQHLSEHLPSNICPLDYMQKEYPSSTQESMRAILGRYGISGALQTRNIDTMSGGQKARLVLAWLSEKHPHILMLDEPTNSLDIETIDALAKAINEFSGGLVLISHDFRLINQVAEEIWEIKDGNVRRWNGDITDYKKHLEKEIENN
jgi:ATP-binding cassette subfamily F protein 2